jgi:hypothetical protein
MIIAMVVGVLCVEEENQGECYEPTLIWKVIRNGETWLEVRVMNMAAEN